MIKHGDRFDEEGGEVAHSLGTLILKFADDNDIGMLELIGMMEFIKARYIDISFTTEP